MKNNKYFYKLIFIILLLISIYSFTYNSSSAKYYSDNKENPLTYGAKFMKMGGKAELNRLDSTDKTLKYSVEINRNLNSMDETTDERDRYVLTFKNNVYKVNDVEQEKCRVDSILVTGNSGTYYTNNNEVSFTQAGTEKIIYNVSCVVSQVVNNTQLQVDMDINEYIHYKDISDIAEFAFSENIRYEEDKATYDARAIKEFTKEELEELEKNPQEYTSATASYGDLVGWLLWYKDKYSKDSSQSIITEYLEYIGIKRSNDNTIKFEGFDSNKDTGITYDSNTSKFVIQNQFFTYANTHYNSKNATTFYQFHFLDIEESTYYTIFQRYIKEYNKYSEDSDKYKTVMEKITGDNIKNLLNGTIENLFNITCDKEKKILNVPTDLYEIIVKEPYSNTATTDNKQTISSQLVTYITKIVGDTGDIVDIALSIRETVDEIITRSEQKKTFDSYSYYIVDNNQFLIHFYTTADDIINNEIHYEIKYTEATTETLNYSKLENSANNDENIIADLNTISNNLYATDLVLKDKENNIINNPITLEVGQTYKSNIGEITVTEDDTNKIITIDFSKKIAS